MKILLERTNSGYKYIAPYRGKEHQAIEGFLKPGRYVIAKIISDISIRGNSFDKKNQILDENINTDVNSLELTNKTIVTDFDSLRILLLTTEDVKFRFHLLKTNGVDVNEDDLKFARNPNLFKGPNEDSYSGRLLKIDGKSVFLTKDLNILDWEEYKNTTKLVEQKSSEATDSPKEEKKPESITEQKQESARIETPKVSKQSLEPKSDLEKKLDQLERMEENGSFKKKESKGYDQFTEAIADPDEDAIFASLERDLAVLDSASSIEEIEDAIPSVKNKNTSDSSDCVILSKDKLTVTVSYNGSTYKKTFKSDSIAERNARSISSIMEENPASLSEILDGPTTIYKRVEVQ